MGVVRILVHDSWIQCVPDINVKVCVDGVLGSNQRIPVGIRSSPCNAVFYFDGFEGREEGIVESSGSKLDGPTFAQ